MNLKVINKLFLYWYTSSPLLVKEIASVKTKYYKYFVPKQATNPFYFKNNSNYWNVEFVKI